LSLSAIANHWDNIDPEKAASMIRPVLDLFEGLKSLKIDSWTKTEETEGGKKVAHIAPMLPILPAFEQDSSGEQLSDPASPASSGPVPDPKDGQEMVRTVPFGGRSVQRTDWSTSLRRTHPAVVAPGVCGGLRSR
jgi:hypothetical protein